MVALALLLAGCIQQSTPISSDPPPPPPVERAVDQQADSPPVFAEDDPALSPEGELETGAESDIAGEDVAGLGEDPSGEQEAAVGEGEGGYISADVATSVFANATPLSSSERTEVFSVTIKEAREARMLVYSEADDAIQGELALNEIALPVLLTERVENILLVASPTELRRTEALRVSLAGAKERLVEVG